MRLLSLLLLWGAAPAPAQPDARGILARVDEAYTHLAAIRIAATRTDLIEVRNGSTLTAADYELAERAPGKFRSWMSRNSVEALVVSDGSVTRRALPKSKLWSEEIASDIATGDDDDSSASQDLHARLVRMLLAKYVRIARDAKGPQVLREETCSLQSGKAPCYVVRAYVGETRFDLWIDKTRYLVLRDQQKGPQQSASGPVTATIDTKVKDVRLNDAVPDSLFTFVPDSKWVRKESLVLPEEHRITLVGTPAADFSLPTIANDAVRVSALRGQVVVLDFWATWCPPCREELPLMKKLSTEFSGKAQFFAISDEPRETISDFAVKKGIELAMLVDEKHQAFRRYRVGAIPTLIVIDRNGIIRGHVLGGRSEGELRKAIQSVIDRP